MSAGTTPFHDLSDFVAIPRVARRLPLAPGRDLAGGGRADAERRLQEVPDQHLADRHPGRPGPGGLPRFAEGEGQPAFPARRVAAAVHLQAPRSGRKNTGPDGDSGSGDDVPALWLLPAAGGEARTVAALPGGVTAAEAAKDAGGIVVSSPAPPAAGAAGGRNGGRPPVASTAGGREGGRPPVASTAGNGSSAEDDAAAAPGAQGRRDHRHLARVGAGQVLGPRPGAGPAQAVRRRPRPGTGNRHRVGGGDKELSVADEGGEDQGHEGTERAAKPPRLRDLTPEPGRALDGEAFELTPDGTSVVTGWWQWDPAGESHCELVMIDVASGKRRVLLSVPEFDFSGPRVSPDGQFIVCQRERHATAERPIEETLVLLDVDDSDAGGSDAGG